MSAVVGTSICAINAWFVATAQYSALARVWQTISTQDIFRIKKRYAATLKPSSGVLTRVFQAALISGDITSNVAGLLDGTPVREWLTRNIDPNVPLVMTHTFALTNLNEQRSEVFYRSRIQSTPGARALAGQRLRAIFGKTISAREVDDTLCRRTANLH